MSSRGLEGTVLGTLFMPYFSGMGNLMFVWVVFSKNGPAEEIIINAWTNNITNLCLLISLSALIWGLNLKSVKKTKSAVRTTNLHRLSLSLTIVAMIFFSLIVWVLGQDGKLDQFDGITLVALFLFWQCFHIYEVLKENTRQHTGWSLLVVLDLALIAIGSLCTLLSVDGIVRVILQSESKWLGADQLGLITGFLMVLPNAILAFYYARQKRSEIVYSSQIGDAHICIPLCIGLFAILKPIPVSEIWNQGLLIIAVIAAVHLFCLLVTKGLPKIVAAALLCIYGYLLYSNATL